jgi:hypothetical protein
MGYNSTTSALCEHVDNAIQWGASEVRVYLHQAGKKATTTLSLAGELRLAGGYAKDTTPFSEFLWADFLRRRIKRQNVEKDFDAAF